MKELLNYFLPGRRILTMSLVILVLGLAGCGKRTSSNSLDRNPEDPLNSPGPGVTLPGSQTPQTPQPSTGELDMRRPGELVGYITTTNLGAVAFEDHLNELFFADITGSGDDYIGWVDRDASDGTGAFLGGDIKIQGGARVSLSSGQNALQIEGGTSTLLVCVVDKKVEIEPELCFDMPLLFGNITGNSADLTFADDSGQISLEGSFDRSFFVGALRYNNSNSTSGTLNFVIATCQFFDCRE